MSVKRRVGVSRYPSKRSPAKAANVPLIMQAFIKVPSESIPESQAALGLFPAAYIRLPKVVKYSTKIKKIAKTSQAIPVKGTTPKMTPFPID